ncbi:MAG: carboxypeptidase regulatory-like domain-containing protein [Bacteriovoracaceae bacterium]|nr:carboxypeptidase regulatory-like domain-containing protein [Bacteroidota bacterium]
MKLAIRLLLMMSLLASAMYAQGVTSAALSGKVVDATGQAIVGANIVALHEPSGTKFGNISRDDGNFNIANVRPGGPYTIKVSLLGYQDKERKNVFVQLGDNLELNFSIAEKAIEAAEVVIIGEAGVFSASKMGSGNVVTTKDMDKVPSISRNFEDFYKLSPYISGSNAAGKNKGYNNIQIDGANYNDLFGLGGTTPGSQSRATPISLDAIEQFQLEIAPYDVRKFGFTGAGINAITRSGGNTFTGSVFYYGQGESFIGKSPDKTHLDYPELSDNQVGFRLGGPIIQNEMFFFINGEMTRNTTTTKRNFGAATQTTNTYTLLKDSVDKMVSILKNKYGYESGPFDVYDVRQNSEKIFGRIDWNITDEHRLTIRHSYLSALYDNSPSRGRGASDIYSENGQYVVENVTNSSAVLLKSTFGSDMANEFIVGLTYQYDTPKYIGAKFPAVYVETKGADNKSYTLISGAEQFRHQNELDQEALEISDNFSYYMGDHTISAGVRMESFAFRNLFLPNNFGTYRFASLSYLESGIASSTTQNNTVYEYQYSFNGDPSYAIKWNAVTYGGYIQDEWQVDPQLRLNAGFRIDVPTYSTTPAYNYKVDSTFKPQGYDIATNQLPESYFQFSPRFGFNYDLDGERNTQIRGGIGVFAGRIPYVWVSNQYGNTGVEYGRVTAKNTGSVPPGVIFNTTTPPSIGSTGISPSATYEIDVTSKDFKNPSVLRYSLSVDQKLPMNLSATAEMVFAKTLNDITYQDINLKDVTDTIAGENRLRYGSKYNGTFTNVMYLSNEDQGGQMGFSFQLTKSPVEDNISFTGGYVYGSSEDINSGISAQAVSQWRYNPIDMNPNKAVLTNSAWDRTHRIYASIGYTYDWAQDHSTNIELYYNGQSGRGFSYVTDGDANGDGANGNDLAYIPKDANDITLVNSAGTVLTDKTDKAYTQLFAFIDNDEYLKDRKGKFAERYGAREPWWHQVDARITQSIGYMGHTIDIYLNIINLMNLINKENGHVRQVADQRTNLLKFKSFDGTGTLNLAKYEWTNPNDPRQPNDYLSRFQMQFGMRYTF